MNNHYTRISPVAFGLALGVFWGGSVFLIGLSVYFFSYGQIFIQAMSTVYKMYTPTLLGSFIGGGVAFIDAFITGVILIWLYNLFVKLIYSKKTNDKKGCQNES